MSAIERNETVLSMQLPLRGGSLAGELRWPRGATGAVLFAHGSGSSRFSRRNQAVARGLQLRGLATLLMDLLTESEADQRGFVFDVDLLARRLLQAADWLAGQPGAEALKLGCFGASTGAAAALTAAAQQPARFRAVVSRGGRPDLARGLDLVQAPSLLIVGGDDTEVLELNRQALAALRCKKKLSVVPHATHLFEEPGTLEEVATLAGDWFSCYLA